MLGLITLQTVANLFSVISIAPVLDVLLEKEEEISLIKDSKKLSIKKRQKAFKFLKDNLKYYGVGFASNVEIDKINILEATKLAMSRAVENLKKQLSKDNQLELLVIDGIRWENCFDIKSHSIIKGDDKYYSISAASIIAKEEHDKTIIEYVNNNNELNLRYDILNNKGYGTKKHLIGLENFGSSDYHRKTFKRCY